MISYMHEVNIMHESSANLRCVQYIKGLMILMTMILMTDVHLLEEQLLSFTNEFGNGSPNTTISQTK